MDISDEIRISLPLREQVADILRRKILNGELEAGSRISEREICEQLNISTTPVKEALRILNTEGLLNTYSRKGTFVADLVDRNTTSQMVFIRSAVEGVAAYFGTIHISDNDIQRMETLLEQFYEIINLDAPKTPELVEKISDINDNFHSILSNACNNEYLKRLVHTLGSVDSTIRYLHYSNEQALDDALTYEEHRSILQYVKEREPGKAEEITVRHIRRIGTSVITPSD